MTIAGLTPRAVVEPQSVAEFAACVGELYARDSAFGFAGGGTALELGNPPRALDTVVKTTGCQRVIDYAPQDQTITLEAGMTLAAAAEVLARERQFLAIDASDPDRVTVGGAVATNLYGARRLRYGGIKDTIVGVEIVRPDGTRARGGGKVVKNVAGFDMPKLMVGSLGTLGAIVNATFRVYPIAEQSAGITYFAIGGEQLTQLCRELIGEALVPASVVAFAEPDTDRYDCRVTFEGFARGVDQQINAAKAIAARLGLAADATLGAPPDPAGATATATTALDERERSVRRGSPWHLTVTAAPTALALFFASEAFAAQTQRVIYPMLGTAFIAAASLDAATIARWRTALYPGSVIVNVLPSEAREHVESWGPPDPPAFAIMRRLKANFDPKGLCNAGRFVGGL